MLSVPFLVVLATGVTEFLVPYAKAPDSFVKRRGKKGELKVQVCQTKALHFKTTRPLTRN